RGRLFLGIGGRDHFGIRGRIASEFADLDRVVKRASRVLDRFGHRNGALKTYAEIRFDYHGGYGGPYFASSGIGSR
ncbi:hypothetical protein GOA88_17560, partial [Sinorhizobium meliloti]|nr:hypothetical protein [Sinorhizobium meliloti]MDX0070611.1 hypothetical protein [Sinorhizobium meliloti]